MAKDANPTAVAAAVPAARAVVSTVGGSACPQDDDTWVPAIALGTTRSTTNALGTPMDREQAAHTTATRTRGFTLPKQRERVSAFTLAELVVTVGVLVVIVLLFTQLLNSTASITTLGHKQMDADSQARQLLDRMAIDFAQMMKRSDVDYYVKSNPTSGSGVRVVLQPGNDQIAFYSGVSGYLPASNYKSPLSLVAYRISSNNQMERMGKSLIWNGAPAPSPSAIPTGTPPGPTPTGTPSPTPTSTPVIPTVFIPVPLASPLPATDLPSPPPNPLPTPAWPYVALCSPIPCPWGSNDAEVIGPQVFRFEYYYLMKDGSLSDVPWISPHIALSGPSGVGMQDVAAIVVDIAVIDPKSRVLLTNAQLAAFSTFGNANFLADYQSGQGPGSLLTRWQNTLNTIIANQPPPTPPPRQALSGIRLYERFIYLSPPVQ